MLWGMGKVPMSKTETFGDWWLWRKLLPIIPLVMGASWAFMPGVVCADEPCGWGTKVLVGIWAGFVAAHGRKIIKRLVKDKLKEGGVVK